MNSAEPAASARSQIEPLDELQPLLPMRPGFPKAQTYGSRVPYRLQQRLTPKAKGGSAAVPSPRPQAKLNGADIVEE